MEEQPKQLHNDEFIFRSKLPDIYIPTHLPLHTYCFEKLSKFQNRPCLINGTTGETFTYADVELISRKVAAGFNNLGIQQGDVILLLLQNCPQFVFAFLGASFRGATVTTANPFYTPAEVAKQATASNSKLIITQSSYVDKVKDLAINNNIKVLCIDSPPEGNFLHFSELTKANEFDIPAVKISPDDVVALPYSSGTTGLPKGVMLTHKGLVTSVAQQVDGENPNLYFHNNDVVLCVLPLFHIYSLNSVLLCGLRVGAAILIMQKFEIITLLELVQKHRVSIAPFVPPIVLAIAKSPDVERYDLSSIRMVMSGAAPMGKELEDAVREKLPNAILGQGYGMTEAGPVLSMCLAFAKEPLEVKSGACGTVVRNADMKIIEPETCATLPRNQAGEICIRGNQIMKGIGKMENTMSSGKVNDRKVRTLNENVSPLKIELDDKRVRYLQSMTATPGLPQPYAENVDGGSPARYFFAGSPVSRKAGEAFTPPTFGASKYRSAKTQQYSGTSSGNSSFSSRGRLSLSPLSSIENLEISSFIPSPMYGTPVKVDEEVLVMDDIQVRPILGGKSGRSSSSSSGRNSSSSKSTFKTEICRTWEESGTCRYNSKCQFAHGREELLVNRLTMKSKSEAQTGKLSTRPGPYIYGPNSRNSAAAESELAVTISQPASPESHHTFANFNTTSDWSPLDDGIEVVLPNGSDKTPSREEVDAYISRIQYGPTTKRRLAVFATLTEGQQSP